MAQELKQLRVKIFDELSKIVDPEINTTITELELIARWTDVTIKVTCTLRSSPALFGSSVFFGQL